MLVFGDRTRVASPRELLDTLRAAAAEPATGGEAWILRHARLVELFIEAAGLAQAVLDSAFAHERKDRLDADTAAIDAALRTLASAMIRSWTDGHSPASTDFLHAVGALSTLPLPERIETKEAEGYAHYALYPESYAVAAQALAGTSPVVIGLRSIGLGLGAIVATATKATLSFSVRPVGHPFQRELALADSLREALGHRTKGLFAVVDEGPGLSGSSFAAAAQTLEALGVASGRIHFFPSHCNPPGGAATPEIIERWQTAPKHVLGFKELALGASEPRHRLASWVEDLTGPAIAPLQDIGAGAWRTLRGGLADLPASPQKERRKFLLRSERGVFLLRFAGLGAKGRTTFGRARRLAGHGFSPEPLGLRHGFLVERWEEDATILNPRENRSALIAHLAAYLAFRARHLPATAASGATLAQLDEMRRHNIGALLDTPPTNGGGLPPAPPESIVQPVQTDNRMHAWEWLRRVNGDIVKADASDHCDAHDLIGCQDIAWDAVGARIELDLSEDEFSELTGRLRCAGCAMEPSLLAFYESCYLAFQAASFSLDAQAPLFEKDERILGTQAYRYSSILKKRWLRRI